MLCVNVTYAKNGDIVGHKLSQFAVGLFRTVIFPRDLTKIVNIY
jgi:hypothetical protein